MIKHMRDFHSREREEAHFLSRLYEYRIICFYNPGCGHGIID